MHWFTTSSRVPLRKNIIGWFVFGIKYAASSWGNWQVLTFSYKYLRAPHCHLLGFLKTPKCERLVQNADFLRMLYLIIWNLKKNCFWAIGGFQNHFWEPFLFCKIETTFAIIAGLLCVATGIEGLSWHMGCESSSFYTNVENNAQTPLLLSAQSQVEFSWPTEDCNPRPGYPMREEVRSRDG